MHRVAVVEDNADNRLLLSAILGGLYDLREYEDGPAALSGMLATPPDLILMDVSLPGMDGLEVLRRMRVEPALAAIPVIALTAHAMSGDRERLLAAGFDDYVTKPIVDETVLLDAMRAVLGRRA